MWNFDFLRLSVNNFTVFLVFVTTFIVIYLFTRRPPGIPPGPACWPFVGNLPSIIGRDVIGMFNNLRTRYGDVYGLYIGSELNVVLNGYDVIHDALMKRGSVFVGRAKQEIEGNSQLVFANDKNWKDNRTFVLRAFSDLCMTQKGTVLHEIITDELDHLTRHFDKMADSLHPGPHFSASLANVMYTICLGRRAGYDNKGFKWYMDLLDSAFKVYIRNETLAKCFPFLKYLPGDILRVYEEGRKLNILENYFHSIMKAPEEGDEGRNPLCVVERLEGSDSPVQQKFAWVVIHELLAAGSETTATTLTWFTLLMAKYPDIQQQLQDEVQQVIGMETPTLAHRPSMPFVEAVILESLRIGSPVPLSVPHRVVQDINFKGYFIPSGTTIIPNLTSVHFDSSIFPDPMTFNPGRFLSDDGRTIVNTEHVIPFSIGKRSCIGETIARTELFLYVTTMAQRYEFKAVKDDTLPSLSGEMGITHRPQKFHVNLMKRDK